jgi:hypothetical protein
MIYDLVTRFKAPLTSASAIASIALLKPPSSSISNKPSSPYVSRLYAPTPKQINNRAYMAIVARDRVY